MKTASPRAGRLLLQQKVPEAFSAFIPSPLPPKPPLQLDHDLLELLDRSNRALGRLDGVTFLIPDPNLFLYMFVRKEAVLSSQIEGTQSSFSDLLVFETEGIPTEDVKEVSNYISAMHFGLNRLKEDFPLSLRLIKEIHSILLEGVRGGDKQPGEFRTSQNWVGGSRPGTAVFVPPPPNEVMNCMGALEKFIHGEPEKIPLLIKAGLAHVQFESIHPFLDGNGRVGRLLITFILCAEGAISDPLLYLSLFFKKNRAEYYNKLQKVREEGAWEEWIKFYLSGILEISNQAVDTARRIVELFEKDRAKIQELGRGASSAFAVHEQLRQKAIITVPATAKALNLTRPTIAAALARLTELGIVNEITGRRKNRLYTYSNYLLILREGTES